MKKRKPYVAPKSIREAIERMLEYLSECQDLVDLHDFMQDDDLAEAMDLCMKVIAKPDITPSAARNALAKMQGFSMKFRMQSMTYTFVNPGKGGTENNNKKNVYYTASQQCHEMAQTLKYLAKEKFGD